LWAAGYSCFGNPFIGTLGRKPAPPLSVSFASSEGIEANAYIPQMVVACGKQKVSCAGYAVMLVKQHGGGDAKLSRRFSQSNVLNETGES
jgi:hypothetical protein